MTGSLPTVENYMSSPVVAVSPRDSLARARRLLIRYRIGRLVVVDEGERVVGVLTLSDFARAYEVLARRPLEQVYVEEVMTPDPIVVKARARLSEAARIMVEKGFGGLPVVDDEGRLVGIITKTDIVRAYFDRIRGRHRVEDYMTTSFATAYPTHSLGYVVEKLFETPAKRVLVVDGGKLVGIIAPSDIAFLAEYRRGPVKFYRRLGELEKGRIGPEYNYLFTIAADVMTPDPVTVEPEDDLATAAGIMLRRGISSVPVVVDDEPVGLVLKHDILRAVMRYPR